VTVILLVTWILRWILPTVGGAADVHYISEAGSLSVARQ